MSNIGADITEGPSPLTVTFICPDFGPYYEWNFGDGGISSDKEPVHTFQNPGSYIVSIQAYNMVEENRIDGNGYSIEIIVTESNAVVMVIDIISSGVSAIIQQTLSSGTRIIAKKTK